VKIRVGISDGISTEVVEGLDDGEQVVTGIISGAGAVAAGPNNPFGGGFRRF
jgi:HlyD family secretion protein